jgi:hypothetical protein
VACVLSSRRSPGDRLDVVASYVPKMFGSQGAMNPHARKFMERIRGKVAWQITTTVGTKVFAVLAQSIPMIITQWDLTNQGWNLYVPARNLIEELEALGVDMTDA